MKKIIVLIFAFIGLFATINPAWAENFYIQNYSVDINVNKDKSVNVKEVIDVYFTQASHGIIRQIPVKDGSTVSDIFVADNHENSYSLDGVNIKIGNPDKYVVGKQTYVIQYKYNYYDNKNEFYYNIIGTNWDVNINKAEFSVVMPEDFDHSKAGLSIGSYGKKGFKGGAVFKVNGRVLSGYTQRTLAPYEGITLRVELPEGYFTKNFNWVKYATLGGIILLTLIAFLIWFIYGRDDKTIPVVNFYPPKGLNAAEIELTYGGSATGKGLVALLIELAQRGYIKIVDNGARWSLIKRRRYDGYDQNEKDFMDAIFENAPDIASQEMLETSDTFYKKCKKIIRNINNSKSKVFTAESTGFFLKTLMFLCIGGITFLSSFAIVNYDLSSGFYIFSQIFVPAVIFLYAICSIVTKNISQKNKLTKKVYHFRGWEFIISFVLLLAVLYSTCAGSAVIIGAAAILISVICTCLLPKRSKVGQQLYNNLLGLKHFIEVAEKNRLRLLVEKDPEYFYGVLPTAYIFGISDKWIDQFESIMHIEPDWYSGNFRRNRFNNFTESFKSTTQPSVANGGISTTSSSGGGGYSGGGGGGGGGSSW